MWQQHMQPPPDGVLGARLGVGFILSWQKESWVRSLLAKSSHAFVTKTKRRVLLNIGGEQNTNERDPFCDWNTDCSHKNKNNLDINRGCFYFLGKFDSSDLYLLGLLGNLPSFIFISFLIFFNPALF